MMRTRSRRTLLVVVITLAASPCFGQQLDGGSTGPILPPSGSLLDDAIEQTDEAFEITLGAYGESLNAANLCAYWRNYHPTASIAESYWRATASIQYSALIELSDARQYLAGVQRNPSKLYYVYKALESSTSALDRLDLADVYASVASNLSPFDSSRALIVTRNSKISVELLVRILEELLAGPQPEPPYK